MAEYKPGELKLIQELELEMYHDFKKICDEYHLTYFGYAGTGIGALRHEGFIPWDDDIDIFMPRRDYEKLNRIVAKKWSDKYFVLNTRNYRNYPLATTRMCLKGTTFKEVSMKDVDCPYGIFLDLYALDNVADNRLAYWIQMWSSWFWGKMLILRSVSEPVLSFYGPLTHVVTAACKITNKAMDALGVSKDWLYRKREAANRKYSKKKTKRIGFFCDPTPYKLTFYNSDIYPLRELKFEDTTMPFPQELEKFLKKMYGDFMQLPPEDRRKSHCPYMLDFGPYKDRLKED